MSRPEGDRITDSLGIQRVAFRFGESWRPCRPLQLTEFASESPIKYVQSRTGGGQDVDMCPGRLRVHPTVSTLLMIGACNC